MIHSKNFPPIKMRVEQHVFNKLLLADAMIECAQHLSNNNDPQNVEVTIDYNKPLPGLWSVTLRYFL